MCTFSQADKSRVKDYIHRLDKFDGPAVGEIAVGYELYDEAFEIYKKFDLKAQAIKVLLDHTDDLNRALEYASKVRPSQPCSFTLPLVLLGFHPVPFILKPLYSYGWHMNFGGSWHIMPKGLTAGDHVSLSF
jgi:hypothetical protein